ncbi:MAG TPA: hypothetical protein DCY03_29105 [Planctomycetaceae bacterium]|nr:hypothetical protein [Planctomycetaceae bacterium]|tara:strand:- start:310 stop:579 length:270 start_codon:yes stop_codon:yes gene_type:complete
MRWDMPRWEMIVGALEIFILGWLFGATTVFYNVRVSEARYQTATHLALAMEGAGDGGEIAIDREGGPLIQRELGCVYLFRTLNQLSVIS